MNIHLSQREIHKGYRVLKSLALRSFKEGEIEKSLDYVSHCATIAQQFNWIYADDELEDLLKDIGQAILSQSYSDYVPIADRVVFIDDFCTSFILALQYLRALVANGKDILYLTTRNIDTRSKFSNIIEEVKSYPKLQVCIIAQGNKLQRIRDIYKAIVAFKPEKVLLHVLANSVSLPALYHLPASTERYIINLADQTFWLGTKAIDFSLEFRPFGASVSIQKRGLKPEQLLMVPFYPVIDSNPFEGFPPECSSDKVIIFSGGDIYKVIDRKRMYWKLIKCILDRYPNTVFLFASKVNDKASLIVNDFIESNGFQGRFFYIDYRKDIAEVFKHCDIYMGTCPASGSLMSQLAAIHSKPILQYYYPGTPDDETEQAIAINEAIPISFQNEDEFLIEADKLIRDVSYRKQRGELLKQAMMNPRQFDDVVNLTLGSNTTHFSITNQEINYRLLEQRWYLLEKTGYIDTLPFIYGLIGKKLCISSIPSMFIKKQLRRLIHSS